MSFTQQLQKHSRHHNSKSHHIVQQHHHQQQQQQQLQHQQQQMGSSTGGSTGGSKYGGTKKHSQMLPNVEEMHSSNGGKSCYQKSPIANTELRFFFLQRPTCG